MAVGWLPMAATRAAMAVFSWSDMMASDRLRLITSRASSGFFSTHDSCEGSHRIGPKPPAIFTESYCFWVSGVAACAPLAA
ncbi:hypothetical protein D3C87_1633660 [compost metagenome]